MGSTQVKGAAAGMMLAAAVALPAAQEAEASGFAIREQSGTALGNAFAGAPTGIDDVSYMYFNPAMMGHLDGYHAALSNSYIIPDSKFKNGEASTTAPINAPINRNNLFDGNEDIGRDALIPAIAGMASITDDIKVGISITAPFGLLTDNPDGWEGRYHALKSELKTIDINPAVAYSVTDYLTVAGGFRAVYAEAELSQNIDFGTIGAANAVPGSSPTNQDGRAKLQGDDWGFGGNFGVMLDAGKLSPQLEGLRAGVAYRSRVELNIDGKTDFQKDSAGIAATLQAASGQFRDTGASAHLDLPESVSFGLNYDLNEEWAVMGQAEWTNWSEFKTLRVEFDNDNQADSVTEEDWKDTWFFSVGTTWRPMAVKGLSLRLGLAYDQSPVPESTRTPRIPDEDRYWVAAGVGYSPFSWLDLSLGYTHIFIPDADIDLKASDEGNSARGNLEGKYEANIDIVAFQGTIHF